MLYLVLLLALANLCMVGVMGVQAWRYRRWVGRRVRDDVPVSVLVPSEGDDATLPAVLAAIEATPWRAAREVRVCGPELAGEPPGVVNRKAWFLAAGVRQAVHDVVVVVDSRVVLEPDALPVLVGALDRSVAAFASSRAVPDHPLLAMVSDHLARGHAHAWPVLAGLAWTTGDAPPASGSAMAVRKGALAAAGGFEGVLDRVADDLVLASRLTAVGPVVLADVEAPVRLGDVSPRAWLARWVRWIRVGVATEPWRAPAYPLLLAPLPLLALLAVASVALGDGLWAPGCVAAVWAARVALARVRRDRSAWAAPVADLALFAAAVGAAAGTYVEWRGRRLPLGPGGRILAEPDARAGLAPLWFVALAFFALVGIGLRIDGVVPYGADGLFVLAEGALVAASLRRWGLLAIVAAAGFGAEALGVATGLPFGEYHYLGALGPVVAGVPLAMAPTWIAAVGGAVGIARRGWVEATVLLVATDLVLDPLAAGVLGYWAWPTGGAWYGVPVSNFVGWTIVGAPLCWLFRDVRPGWALTGVGWLNVAFFGALAAWQGLWGPVAVAVAMAAWGLGGRPSDGRSGAP